MKYFLAALNLMILSFCLAQVKPPAYYKQSKSFDEALKKIVQEVGLDSSYDAGEDGKE